MTQEELNKRLLEACDNEDWERVKGLIEKGADVNAKDEWNYTPLYNAVYYQNLEIAKFLIEKGADVNVRDKSDGETPLHNACYKNNLEMVKFLVAKGIDVNVKNEFYESALDLAKRFNHQKITEYLEGLKKQKVENAGK